MSDSVWHGDVNSSFFFNINFPNLGLTQPILELNMLPNTPSLIENVRIFQIQTSFETSSIWPKTSPITLFLHFLSFISSYGMAYMHFSTCFQRRPTLQEGNRSRRDATEHLIFDHIKISDWGRDNLVLFNSPKLNFFVYQLDTTSQITILSSVTLNCSHLLH